MNIDSPVLTPEQARKVLKGRLPHVPVIYEEACKALQKCIDLDEAKEWDDRADALAAWAKIYRNDDAGRKAKQLKLRAYRRMGEIAAELRSGVGKGVGRRAPGPASLLMESGLNRTQSVTARRLAIVPRERFESVANRPAIPSPTYAAALLAAGENTPTWNLLRLNAGSPVQFRGFCRKHPARELARELKSTEAELVRSMLVEIQEWLDEFEQYLPKVLGDKA